MISSIMPWLIKQYPYGDHRSSKKYCTSRDVFKAKLEKAIINVR